MKKIIVTLLLVFSFSLSLFARSYDKETLNEMMSISENSYNEILRFIGVVENEAQQKKLLYALKYSKGLFKYFLSQSSELTQELEEESEVYAAKMNLAKAFELLLDKKFVEIEKKLKEGKTLANYRYRWFQRAMFVYLQSKIELYRYYLTLESGEEKYEYRLKKSYKGFESYLSDLMEFIYKNKELYQTNSIFVKKVFLIDDASTGYASQESQVVGDVDLLIEFLKGKFTDYQGLYVQFVSFRKSEVAGARDQGIVLLMRYQPIPAGEKIKDVREVEVSVQGDNLEDILTYTLNQASQLISQKVSSDKKMHKLRTSNMNYQKLVKENILLAKTAVLKATLIFKKEIKPKKGKKKRVGKKKKILEVGLRLKVGKKAKAVEKPKQKLEEKTEKETEEKLTKEKEKKDDE